VASRHLLTILYRIRCTSLQNHFFGALGALVIALMWNAPADGYEKFNKLVEAEKNKISK
jgi:hypothetical protein